MPELHSLNLHGCRKITDVGLHALSNLLNLRQIVLSRCGVRTLQPLSKLSQLMTLNLSGCARVSDASLLNLSNCTQLRAVNVSHCKQVSKHGLASILGL
jgi:Leucine-rich repeat (LRR) protein